MFYHNQLNSVVKDFKDGKITRQQARIRFAEIEDLAYHRIPHAEPDGDITFAVALAVAEISEQGTANTILTELIADHDADNTIIGAHETLSSMDN